MSEFAKWDSFYLILGSASGALIGLQFVVLTLIAEKPELRASGAGAAFATPTIVHFGAALLLSLLQRVPWQTIRVIAVLWGLVGFAGIVYSLVVIRRMRTQGVYRPELEDWMFFGILPLAAYATLATSAFAAPFHTPGALFGIAAAALLLLFIGIHNAWDSVAYHVFGDERSAAAARPHMETPGEKVQAAGKATQRKDEER